MRSVVVAAVMLFGSSAPSLCGSTNVPDHLQDAAKTELEKQVDGAVKGAVDGVVGAALGGGNKGGGEAEDNELAACREDLRKMTDVVAVLAEQLRASGEVAVGGQTTEPRDPWPGGASPSAAPPPPPAPPKSTKKTASPFGSRRKQ